jgi:dihydropyrimidine dehydrogenase (NAD+) subunit PreA
MIEGLNDYLDAKGMAGVSQFIGAALPQVQPWETLDLNYKRIARIDYETCIGCNLCYIACEDGAHQSIALVDPAQFGNGPGRAPGRPIPKILKHLCVGCNLCSMVCPVDGCITMVDIKPGAPKMSWDEYQARLARGVIQPIPAHT